MLTIYESMVTNGSLYQLAAANLESVTVAAPNTVPWIERVGIASKSFVAQIDVEATILELCSSPGGVEYSLSEHRPARGVVESASGFLPWYDPLF